MPTRVTLRLNTHFSNKNLHVYKNAGCMFQKHYVLSFVNRCMFPKNMGLCFYCTITVLKKYIRAV